MQCSSACPLWAKSGLMQRNKNGRYSITLGIAAAQIDL
jgi:hypothetical protein